MDVALRENHLRTARVLTDFGGRTNGGTHHRAASLIQAVWKFHVHKVELDFEYLLSILS